MITGVPAIIVFAFSIAIHEWGHYLTARHYKVDPYFIFAWWGIAVSGFWEKMTFWQKLLSVDAGIIAGIWVYLVFNVPVLWFYYYIAVCVSDFLQMYIMLICLKKYGNRKMVDLPFLIGG